jgi:hypothetical protein
MEQPQEDTMKKVIATVVAGGLLIVGTAGTAAPLQGDGGGGVSGMAASNERHRHHPRRAALRIAAGAAAETIGVQLTDLRDAVRGGQTVAALAESHGVDPGAVEQAVVGALTDAVDRAVSEGRLSEGRAVTIKERIPGFAERVVNTVPKRFDDDPTPRAAT